MSALQLCGIVVEASRKGIEFQAKLAGYLLRYLHGNPHSLRAQEYDAFRKAMQSIDWTQLGSLNSKGNSPYTQLAWTSASFTFWGSGKK